MAALVADTGRSNDMEILITGGNGLLGHHLVSALQARGDDVRVLALPAEDVSWLQKRDVAVHRGDIRFPDTLIAPMRRVDAVLHLAGMMGVWRPLADYRAVNVTGTENVCAAALSAGVRRIVHVSSWTVYGMALGQPAREDFPFNPFKEPYALTKAEGDRVVQRMIAEHDLPAVIIRPGTFFGPDDRLHFGRIADRVAADRAVVVGSGENALPFVYVSDVVQGLLLGLDCQNAIGEAYNITTDRPLSQLQLLRAIARAIGAGPPRVFVPYRALYAGAFAAERVAALARLSGPPVVTRLGVKLFGTDNRHAIDKAREALGYRPRVALEEGVRLAARWYLKSSGRQLAEPVSELRVEPDVAGVTQS
jgi:nucleoside-diphosphate-sugar epimerase